jgi:hypothetical protein
MTDPIQPVIDALKSAIATPNQNPPGTNTPDEWKAGKATPTNKVVVDAISQLMQVLYGASNDMKGVGSDINSALTEVATVITALADQIDKLGQIKDVAAALGQLQQGLALAQTLAPTGPVAVLDSASKLFQQISDLLTAAKNKDQAAIELYQLAQQLEFVASTLKPK